MDHDVGERLLAGQHRREQDAVVVAVRLGAEHGDVRSGPGARASSSSTVRIPAMPLPMTTSFSLGRISSWQQGSSRI